MVNGWEIYSMMLLSAGIALSVPILVFWANLFLRADSKERLSAPRHGVRAPVSAHSKINTRYFLAVNVILLLVSLGLSVIPISGAFREMALSGDYAGVLKASIAVLSVSGFLALALFYSARKGDLSWLRSYRASDRATLSSEEDR